MFNAKRVLSTKSLLIKVIAVFSVITLCCVYVFDVRNRMALFLSGDPVWTESDWDAMQMQHESSWDPAYYVKTNGCRMPSFREMNDNVRKYFQQVPPIVCAEVLTVANDTHVWVPHNSSHLNGVFGISDPDSIICTMDALSRVNDKANEVDTSKRRFFKYGQAAAAQSEFVVVTCNFNQNNVTTNYHYFVAPKFGMNHESEKSDKMSVMMIGIDSVSRLNFHRKMKQTALVLKQLNAFELYGYNKIGDNTYPNLMAILTGLHFNELEKTCLLGAKPTFDGCSFIWNLYKDRGYNTVFAEDWSYAGLFNFDRPGFSIQPTDLRLRPLIFEMEAHATSQQGSCLGGERTADILLNYIGLFVRSIGWLPYFSLFWTSTYSHFNLNKPQLIDKEVASLIGNITSSETFENTFLFVMSDHGIRFGNFRKTYQGSIEERLPFMFLIPPKWFKNRFPDAIGNLMGNRRSLTTPFDIYESLRDILEPDQLSKNTLRKRAHDLSLNNPMPRGISLFLPVPSIRSCATASISPHWCTCHEKQLVATNDQRVQRMARGIVQHINERIDKFVKCQRLTLNAIFEAHIATSNADITNTTGGFVDITVRIQTKPGMAEFEATSRLHDSGQFEKTGGVSRTNEYGDQSACVNDTEITLYCFCDGFL